MPPGGGARRLRARRCSLRDGKTILSYGCGAGYTPLRELIGEWFKVHPHQVILTNGGLQGFVLLAQHFGRGQTVLRRVADLRPAAEDPARERR